MDVRDFSTIEREIYIDASPDIVYDVVSNPQHVAAWWPDDARYEPVAGSNGELRFGDPEAGGDVVGFAVVEARSPHLFRFRWTQPVGEAAVQGNSLLVTFALEPSGAGTMLTMTETGFREMGWSDDHLQHCYDDHVSGWDHFLPRIAPYVASLGVHR